MSLRFADMSLPDLRGRPSLCHAVMSTQYIKIGLEITEAFLKLGLFNLTEFIVYDIRLQRYQIQKFNKIVTKIKFLYIFELTNCMCCKLVLDICFEIFVNRKIFWVFNNSFKSAKSDTRLGYFTLKITKFPF